MAAQSQENGLIAVFHEAVQGQVPAQGHIGLDLHPPPLDVSNLFFEDILGQAVIGNAHPQHAARYWQSLKNGAGVAATGQMVGTGEAGGTGTDNGDFFAFPGDLGDGQFGQIHLVSGEALQIADGDGLVHLPAAAGALAGVGTDPADHPRQGQLLHDEFDGFLVFAHFDELDIALHLEGGRTGGDAGGPVQLFDGKLRRDGLGKMAVGRAPGAQTFIKS